MPYLPGDRRQFFDAGGRPEGPVYFPAVSKNDESPPLPGSQSTFNQFIQEYPTGPADLGVSNYGLNFRVGGCDYAPWPYSQFPGVRGAIPRPAGVAYLADSGTKPLNTTNPLACVTASTPEKPGCWILHDPGDDAPDTGGVSGDDPNWGGPDPRHNGRSAVAFMDGHIASLKPSAWYWSLTPGCSPPWGDYEAQPPFPRNPSRSSSQSC